MTSPHSVASPHPQGEGAIEKLPTGIAGFDLVALGGLPKGRTTLVAGTAGSAKTIFAAQYLAEGIRQSDEHGVFVTFEEPPADIRRNVASMGWDIAAWEAANKWAFVDACVDPGEDSMQVGAYDLDGLMARLEHAIRRVQAKRVSVDSLGAIFTRFDEPGTIRRELQRVVASLKQLGVTAVLTTEFIGGGVASQERSLLLAFEESREQLYRNAIGWGHDFATMEARGLLCVVSEYPESGVLEDHLLRIKDQIDAFEPTRVAIDSLSALERVGTPKSFREFVIGLTSYIKEKEIAGLFTATSSTLLGAPSVTDAHISTITDSIILLRYVELYGEMRRGLTVLKMRGSMHDKQIREFSIDSAGMHIGQPFRHVAGILAGNPRQVSPDEIERIDALFQEG